MSVRVGTLDSMGIIGVALEVCYWVVASRRVCRPLRHKTKLEVKYFFEKNYQKSQNIYNHKMSDITNLDATILN